MEVNGATFFGSRWETGHNPQDWWIRVKNGEIERDRVAPTVSRILAFDMLGKVPDDKTVYYFAGIDGARFKRPVEPGDQLILEVSLDRHKSGIFKFNACAKVGEDIATEASLMCTMRTIA